MKVRAFRLLRGRLLFQPLLREAAAADLVVIDHANRFLLNHLLLPLSLLRCKRVAFWGLGENLQANRSPFSEWYKEKTLNWVHWWFAYTAGTARYLEEHGVPRRKITAVQNSVDTSEIEQRAATMTVNARIALRARLGIPASACVGVFVGMLHPVKSLPFLLEAAATVRQSIPDFELVLVGGGPEQEALRKKTANSPWVHLVGPQFGRRKARILALADLFLLPGRAGLAVLDAFAAGLPLIATRLPIHGPEMEYLEPGRNGLLTESNPRRYAEAIVELLSDPAKLQVLREGARLSAQKYSLASMVANFRDGILQCLAQPLWHPPRGDWRAHRSAPGEFE